MIQPLHIIFITREIIPYYYGGIGTLFKAQAKLLLRENHRVSFITRPSKRFDSAEIRENYGDVDFYFIDIPEPSTFVDYSPSGGVISTYNLAYSVAVANQYQKIADELSPDIVVSADFCAESFFLLFQKKMLRKYPDTRFILHISGGTLDAVNVYEGGKSADQLSELDELQNQLNCAMEECAVYLASEIITPTNIAWKQVSERLKFFRSVNTVPNLLDKDLFCQRRKSNLEDDKYILFIGRLDRHKGADLLLKFFLERQEELMEDIKLVFVGRDCFWKEYGMTFLEFWREKISTRILEKIIFTGQIDHVRVKEYIERSSICVFPSRWEVFGIVCLEAMSYGVPVVVSENTGLVEVLGEELREFVVNFDTGQEKLLEIVHSTSSRSQEQRKELRNAIRERYEYIVQQSESEFLDVIENGGIQEDSVGKKMNERIFSRLFLAVSAVSDISHFLSNDILKMKNHFEVNEKTYKEIVRDDVVVQKGIWQSMGSWMKNKLQTK